MAEDPGRLPEAGLPEELLRPGAVVHVEEGCVIVGFEVAGGDVDGDDSEGLALFGGEGDGEGLVCGVPVRGGQDAPGLAEGLDVVGVGICGLPVLVHELVVLRAHVSVVDVGVRLFRGRGVPPGHAGREIGRAFGRLRREGGRAVERVVAALVVPADPGGELLDGHVLAEVSAVVAVQHDGVRILLQDLAGGVEVIGLEGVGLRVEPYGGSVPAPAGLPDEDPGDPVADLVGVVSGDFIQCCHVRHPP